MKKTIFIFLFSLFCIFILNVHGAKISKESIVDFATGFLKNLQAKDIVRLKEILSKNIQLKSLDKKNLLALADNMMLGKLSVSEYILKISGHNIQQFLSEELELVKYGKYKECGIEKNMGDIKIKGNLYYVKFEISCKGPGNNIRNRLIEIDIIKENNKFTIFGFII